jgi:RHH-type proline utilization regulon transcriptional repressor/proline dehydrogenase/delta 1-pyrroline-5-carboxylate dehydrogenase
VDIEIDLQGGLTSNTVQLSRRSLQNCGVASEEEAVMNVLDALELTGGARHRAVSLGVALVEGARARRDERPFLDAFLQEFGRSNQEGIALMCIAEALLRIPDDATADRLIAEQLAAGDWSSHAGRSESLFVNASTWGLMLTGGILDLDPSIKADAAGWMRKMTREAGEPLVRLAVRRAMKIIGGEFVVGCSIEEALERSGREADVALCSFDMLGEGARTLKDADRYLKSTNTRSTSSALPVSDVRRMSAPAYPSSCPPSSRATR